MTLNIPNRIPEPGFYYHYKHDPAGPINNYAYEVIGTGFHTESDCRPIDHNLVVYRPIYESSVYVAGKFFDIRPLSMFLEQVADKSGKLSPRFAKIDDQSTVSKLEEIRNKMYRS